MKILVVDTETTGLKNFNNIEDIVEIGITEVDLDKKSITMKYDSVIGFDLKKVSWAKRKVYIFDNINAIDREEVDIKKNSSLKNKFQVAEEVRNIIKGNIATSYNFAFDFGNYLSKSPWFINNMHKQLNYNPNDMSPYLDFINAPCIMLSAKTFCKIPHYYGYKFPTLDEAMDYLSVEYMDITMDDYTKNVYQDHSKRHRAYYDAVQASMVLLGLYEQGHYEVDKIANKM